MKGFSKNKYKGFTLMELVITLVLVSLLSSLAAVVILGPFQIFYTMRDNVKLFAQFDQVSNDLVYNFKQVAPFSVEVAEDGMALSFRRIESDGWLNMSVFSDTLADKKPHKLIDELSSSQAVIFFPEYPEIGMQPIVKKNNSLKLLNSALALKFQSNQPLRYQVLSGLIQYQFISEKSWLQRRGGSPLRETPSSEALVGHLSDCKFVWSANKKRLRIKMMLEDSRQQTYHFRQEIAL